MYDYDAFKKRLVIDPDLMGASPVFTGTRVTVKRIAKLGEREVPLVEIQADYPFISAQDVEFAQRYQKEGNV
jgi:uncharacterized protein (DUF433 family)